ncbi:MAG: SDR family oxidoreductase [Planctomycetes bacterium]|nr:SDR family oxidoreductase [Planctomycetota bacterium]
MDLTNKAALVTGGGSGIGLGIARALAAGGCRVAIAGRNLQRLQEAAEDGSHPPLLVHAVDVADRQDVDGLLVWFREELGPPDILVNSAGINVPNRAMAELDPEQWDQMIAINLTGAYNCIHAVLPDMRSRKSGWIVNISSIAGKRAMALGGAGYCASKFGMGALGTTVGLEERSHGIHVTNIYPGEVDTPILEKRPTPVPQEKRVAMLKPEDIAEMVVAVARLHPRAVVPELVITPLYQEYA